MIRQVRNIPNCSAGNSLITITPLTSGAHSAGMLHCCWLGWLGWAGLEDGIILTPGQ